MYIPLENVKAKGDYATEWNIVAFLVYGG